MYNFIEQNKLITEAQGGFLQSLGINDITGKFPGDIYSNINRGEPTLCIFFDLKKAFDMIDHTILLKKLKLMGFTNDVLDLLANYLSNIQQITKLNNALSSPNLATCGVTQRSTLGPLLFILYINDLPSYIPDIKLKLYANLITESVSLMSSAANKFNRWCAFNKLTANIQKSKCILLSNKSTPLHNKQKGSLIVKIGDIKLDVVDDYIYLGVILDDR